MRCRCFLLLVVALAGCGARHGAVAAPGGNILVRVGRAGGFTVAGDDVSLDSLTKLIGERAACAERDDGLPALSVVISGHPECEYERIQRVMAACEKAGIRDTTWEMAGRRLAARMASAEEIVEPMTLGILPGTRAWVVDPTAAARPQAEPPPPLLRVRICWQNEKQQTIYSPAQVYPDDWPGVRMIGLSTAGAHIAFRIDHEKYADLEAVARAVTSVVDRRPKTRVLIAAWRAVPFRVVFDALDACGKTGAARVVVRLTLVLREVKHTLGWGPSESDHMSWPW